MHERARDGLARVERAPRVPLRPFDADWAATATSGARVGTSARKRGRRLSQRQHVRGEQLVQLARVRPVTHTRLLRSRQRAGSPRTLPNRARERVSARTGFVSAVAQRDGLMRRKKRPLSFASASDATASSRSMRRWRARTAPRAASLVPRHRPRCARGRSSRRALQHEVTRHPRREQPKPRLRRAERLVLLGQSLRARAAPALHLGGAARACAKSRVSSRSNPRARETPAGAAAAPGVPGVAVVRQSRRAAPGWRRRDAPGGGGSAAAGWRWSRARSSPRTRAAGDAVSEAWRRRVQRREASPSSRWRRHLAVGDCVSRGFDSGRRGEVVVVQVEVGSSPRRGGLERRSARDGREARERSGIGSVACLASTRRRDGRAGRAERETDGRETADVRARGRRRRAHLKLGATLRSAARSSASRLWKNDLREGWNTAEEAECGRLARRGAPADVALRRRAHGAEHRQAARANVLPVLAQSSPRPAV